MTSVPSKLLEVFTHRDYAFLPLSFSPFGLAVVDVEALPELIRRPWHCPGREPHRHYFDREASAKFAVRVNTTLKLARQVAGVPTSVRLAYANGDSLDCRRANLSPAPGSRGALRPGSQVFKLEGYQAAMGALGQHEVTQQLAAFRRLSAHPAKAAPEDVRAFLEDMLRDGMLCRGSIRELSAVFLDRTGVSYSHVMLRNIIAGKALRVPGFDYERLAALRPTRSEQALRREEGFRQLGEFGRTPRAVLG